MINKVSVRIFEEQVKTIEGLMIKICADDDVLVPSYLEKLTTPDTIIDRWLREKVEPLLGGLAVKVINGYGVTSSNFVKVSYLHEQYETAKTDTSLNFIDHEHQCDEPVSVATLAKKFSELEHIESEVERLKQEVRNQLIDHRRNNSLSNEDIAEFSGVNYNTIISYFIQKQNTYSLTNLVKRASALGLKVNIVLEDPSLK